jgi:hypothetical protein
MMLLVACCPCCMALSSPLCLRLACMCVCRYMWPNAKIGVMGGEQAASVLATIQVCPVQGRMHVAAFVLATRQRFLLTPVSFSLCHDYHAARQQRSYWVSMER